MTDKEIPKVEITEDNLSPELLNEVKKEKRRLEGKEDETRYIYTMEVGRAKSFRSLMNLFTKCGYLLKLQLTHEEFLEMFDKNERQMVIRRESPEEYMKRYGTEGDDD